MAHQSQSIARPTSGLGYFDITYMDRKGQTRMVCIMAEGFVDVKERFDAHGLGEFRSVKEISWEAYLRWFNAVLTRSMPGGD